MLMKCMLNEVQSILYTPWVVLSLAAFIPNTTPLSWSVSLASSATVQTQPPRLCLGGGEKQ